MKPAESLMRLRHPDRTLVMGVLNITADSFSDGGLYLDPDAAVKHGMRLMEDGADIVDIGAESTRPGAERVPEQAERQRVVEAVKSLIGPARERHVVLSIDTTRASVAQAALDEGAEIINDVSGGLADPAMLALIASRPCLYVIQHWRGELTAGKGLSQKARTYAHGVDQDVLAELERRIAAAREAGIDDVQIVLDPGLGFSKAGDINFILLSHLGRLTRLGFPVLVGASRKKFLSAFLTRIDEEEKGARGEQDGGRMGTPSSPSQERLDEATAILSALAASQGAWAVRVHDAARSADAVRLAAAIGARPSVGRD